MGQQNLGHVFPISVLLCTGFKQNLFQSQYDKNTTENITGNKKGKKNEKKKKKEKEMKKRKKISKLLIAVKFSVEEIGTIFHDFL